MTPGEILFEKYLFSQDLTFSFEKDHPGKTKRPDYTIEWQGSTIVLDVKDFEAPQQLMRSAFTVDPYPRIREKIEQGRDKFKQFKEFCCGLVLYNGGNPLVALHEPGSMLGAMYGDSGFTVPFDPETGIFDSSKMRPAFLGGGKMIRPTWRVAQNTTISAVITLGTIRPDYLRLLDMVHEYPEMTPVELAEHAEGTIPSYDPNREIARVIVWNNAVARIPFPVDLF